MIFLYFIYVLCWCLIHWDPIGHLTSEEALDIYFDKVMFGTFFFSAGIVLILVSCGFCTPRHTGLVGFWWTGLGCPLQSVSARRLSVFYLLRKSHSSSFFMTDAVEFPYFCSVSLQSKIWLRDGDISIQIYIREYSIHNFPWFTTAPSVYLNGMAALTFYECSISIYQDCCFLFGLYFTYTKAQKY